MQGFADAERYADEVTEEKTAKTEDERDGEAVANDLPGVFVGILVGLHAHTEAFVNEPAVVALVDGAIETEMFFELSAVFGRNLPSARFTAAEFASTDDPHFHKHLVYRSTRNKLREREAEDGDAKESWNNEE